MLGRALEMARGSSLTVVVNAADLPLLGAAEKLPGRIRHRRVASQLDELRRRR
jgi:hypothetical protein